MQLLYNTKIGEIQKNGNIAVNTKPRQQSQVGFGEILNEKVSLQFTKHASMRLSSREINLSSEQIKRVESGIDKAREKGISDSLVLVDNIALVINTRNSTVITAMDSEKSDSVFTNIDGAVIV